MTRDVACARASHDLAGNSVCTRRRVSPRRCIDSSITHRSVPVVDRTVDLYREIGSVHGPVFRVLAAAVSTLSGTGELAGRLAWQGVSLVAVAGILVVLRRRGTPWHQVVLIGGSPAVVYLLIHQAHNDVFVGLLILVGATCAQSGRHVPTSLSFAAAALVKAPSGIALVTFVVWLLARRERRAAGWCVASAVVLGAIVVSPFGLSAVLGPLTERSGETNATSLWNVVRGDALSFVWRPERTIDPSAGALVSVAGIVVPVSIAVIAAWRLRSRPVHEPLTVAVLAWVVFSLYPSVWLTGWFVALAGLWSGRVSRLLIGYSSLSLLTSQSWLMPVAAIVDRGTYGWVERLAAMLLGVTSVVGVALIVHLGSGKADRATWNEEGVARLTGAPWGKEVRNDRKGTSQ